jgi:cell division initiation protein
LKLTPIEIRKQEFKKSMRGYDAVEVDTFLETVAKECERTESENEKLQKEVGALKAELKHFKDAEKTLKQTLYNVQETSQQSRENSQKEASIVKKEAELAAANILEKAKLNVHKMRDEINALKQQKESFISRLRHLLSSQLELIDVLEIDDLDKSNIKEKTKSSFRSSPKTKIAAGEQSPAKTPEPENLTEPDVPQSDKKGSDYFDDIFGDALNNDEN